MAAIKQELVRFLWASAINLPITGLLVWVLFRAFKNSGISRAKKMFLSCGLVAVAFAIVSMFSFAREITSDKRLTQELMDLSIKSAVHRQIAVVIWLIIGLLFWDQPKATRPSAD